MKPLNLIFTNREKSLLTVLLFFAGLFSSALYAQVTIGADLEPNTNSLLDLKEKVDNTSTKGLLLPRVSLSSTTAATPLTTHVEGMAVYNKETANDVYPGYYYNDGTKWVRSGGLEFFYMPSMLLPTDTSDSRYNPGNQTFTINLYQNYATQFGLSDLTSSTKNAGATGFLPVLASDKLEYFITYFDKAVFQSVVVDNAGVLTYKLVPSFVITDETFMNIVFRIK